ncbi:MAG: enoyl-CoA hydratase/isomerase family protein [Acidimicrobiia bacterium]|nr:enoyl-CoA hydratase/isomerase family protein [Acidimicrobiia bacterium]
MGEQMIELSRDGDVFVLTMAHGENRWNTTFVREFDRALDEVERSSGPAALVTVSADGKFFSNGLDLEWMGSKGEHPGGDRRVFADEAMTLFGRLITLPVPTVCAIGGHAFGAGLMIALCHDLRVMRADRGFLCANEVALGFAIPEPELALFRHKVPMPAFYETVQFARRWSGTDALSAGIVQRAVAAEEVVPTAMELARTSAPLGTNREVFGWQKEHIYGENAAINGPHGAAYMLRNNGRFASGPGAIPASH